MLLGLPDTALNEVQKGVRSAAKNTGITLTQHRLTVNLTPRPCPNAARRSTLPLWLRRCRRREKLYPSGDSVFLGELGLERYALRRHPAGGQSRRGCRTPPRDCARRKRFEEVALIPGAQVSGFPLPLRFCLLGAESQKVDLPPARRRRRAPPGGDTG